MQPTRGISIFVPAIQQLRAGLTRRVLLYLAAVSLAALLGLAAPARASTVGCAGAAGGPFDFTSLGAALSAGPLTNLTITVSGVCTEAVVIGGAQNLQIIGTPGSALADPGGSTPNFGAVLEIDNSQGVVVQTLTIRLAARPASNGIPGIAVSGSFVTLIQCQIEGAAGSDGIDIFGPNATVRVRGGKIENNNDGQGAGEGIALFGPFAAVGLGRDASGNCPLIQGNGDNGIVVSNLSSVAGGCATIQNNGAGGFGQGIGIAAFGDSTISLVVSQGSHNAIQVLNNGTYGVAAVTGSHLGIDGPVLIQGNSLGGVRVRNAGGQIGSAPDGPAGPTIQQNGTSTSSPCCALPAGISVASNAQLDITAVLVTNNSAPGVLVQDDSSVRIIGPLTINQNPIGVQVINASTAALFFAPTITGNTTIDVVCGPDSVAYGDTSAVGKISCPQFKPQANPVTPPKPGKPMP